MISSRDNGKLKAIRRLRRSKGWRLDGQILVEGPHLLEAAIEAGLRIHQVLATPQYLEMHPDLPQTASGPSASGLAPRRSLDGPKPGPRGQASWSLKGAGARLCVVEAGLLEEFADSDSPRGLLALVEAPAAATSTPASDRPALFLDRVQDPGNLGALVRVAEAFGACQVIFSPGCASLFHPRALRASAGSALRLPYRLEVEASDLPSSAASERTIAALVPHHGSSPYDLQLPSDVVLCVGSEGSGLDQLLVEQADWEITIPVQAPVESLNLSVATALVLFQLARRRSRSVSEYRTGE